MFPYDSHSVLQAPQTTSSPDTFTGYFSPQSRTHHPVHKTHNILCRSWTTSPSQRTTSLSALMWNHSSPRVLIHNILDIIQEQLKAAYLPQHLFLRTLGKSLPTSPRGRRGIHTTPTTSQPIYDSFQRGAINSSLMKLKCWHRYVDDAFAVWPHRPSTLRDFPCHLISRNPTSSFPWNWKGITK